MSKKQPKISSDSQEDMLTSGLPDPDIDKPSKRRRRPRSKRFFTKKRVVVGISSFSAVFVIVGAITAWFLYSNVIFTNLGDDIFQGEADPSTLRGEGDGRINIMLLGIDNAADLSDSIMVASLDPIAKDVALLSIPRDLWVDIPGFGSAKINAAHAFGERYGYEGGGPALTKEVLEDILDIPIHYYGTANFEGFNEAIDFIGGIEVEVEEDIVDYSYPAENNGGFDPFIIRKGVHQMDGETALKYARSRYSTSDFDRSKRQQYILAALKDKVLSLGTLSNPIKVANLLRSFSRNTDTDLKLEEIMRLVEIAREIDTEDMTQARLDASEDNFLTFSNIYGQSALVPSAGDFSNIQEYVRGLLIDSYIKDEAASLSILNGTLQEGLATETAALLRSFGYGVDNINNASARDYEQTVIFDYSGDKPYTLRYLEKRFGVKALRRDPPIGDEQTYDIEIVIGSDYASTIN
ncbi:MAG: LCP family protein [Candidatus Saccharimonadales bacterium]